jgi:hypothetical protein
MVDDSLQFLGALFGKFFFCPVDQAFFSEEISEFEDGGLVRVVEHEEHELEAEFLEQIIN